MHVGQTARRTSQISAEFVKKCAKLLWIITHYTFAGLASD